MTLQVVDGKIRDGMSIKNTVKCLKSREVVDDLMEKACSIDRDYFYKRIRDIYIEGIR